jgi:hypothetical protein
MQEKSAKKCAFPWRRLSEQFPGSQTEHLFLLFSILEAGYGAKISKHDLCNAYKIIPSHPSAWRLHGFSWLSKFFVDTTSIFGSKSAPAHFDCLGFVLALLAATICKIPKKFVHRTLDDPHPTSRLRWSACETISRNKLSEVDSQNKLCEEDSSKGF